MSVKELISKFEMIDSKTTVNFNNLSNIKQIKSNVNGRVKPLISFWEKRISKINNTFKNDIIKKNDKIYNKVFKKATKNLIISKNINSRIESSVNVGAKDIEKTNKEAITILDNKNKSKEIVNKRERLRSRMATVINWPSKS